MGYIVDGFARITILSPNGDHQSNTFELKHDDVYFVPCGYPHYIENIENEQVKIIIFFNQSIAGVIGYKSSFSAYSREVLAATFQCDQNQLENVLFYPQDIPFVKVVNPIDK